MVPQFGFGEMIIILLLAIIVVGPKDLPKLMRTLGGYMARIRMMAQEFRDAFDEMDADDEIKALREEIAEMKRTGLMQDIGLEQDLTDLNLDGEMRELGTEIRDATDMSSKKT